LRKRAVWMNDRARVDCSDKLFVFLKRRDAETTNNESERVLRPSVDFRKVTNGFLSEWGAKIYAALCSIVETGRRNSRSAQKNACEPHDLCLS
jgi:hypothetical protein